MSEHQSLGHSHLSLGQTSDYWSQNPVAGVQVDNTSVVPALINAETGTSYDEYGQFENYDAFLENADLSFLVPQNLDDDLVACIPQLSNPELANSYTASPSSFAGFSISQNIAGGSSGSNIDSQATGHSVRPIARSSSRPIKQQPCWKISTAEYRRILQKIHDFSEVIPKDFSLLSRHTLSRFIEGCVKGFCEHFPFLHIATFSIESASLELILSMAAIGAQFQFENNRKLMLFDAAKAIIVEKFTRREQGGLTKVQADDQRTQTSQALLCLLAVGLWGPKQLLQEGMDLQNLVVRLVREGQGTASQDPILTQNNEKKWKSWIQQESCKRTNFVAYSLLTLLSLAYHTPPPLLTSEIHCSMPCTNVEWGAKTVEEWDVVHRDISAEASFQQNFEILFQNSSSSIKTGLSPFASYTLIVAILQYIFLRRETLLSSHRHSINASDVDGISRALQCWQATWERCRRSDHEDQAPNSPVVYNAAALLRFGWLRLHADLGPCRSLASREPGVIASAFNNCAPIPRGAVTIQPALQAVHALSVPIRMGISFVARTQTISWSVQLSLSNLECAIFLCKWLERLALTCKSAPLESQELKLLMVIHGLVQETGLFEDEMAQNLADLQDQDKKIRRLATGVAKLWAEVFKGMHVFELVDTIGASLAIYAEMMERACSPESSE